MASCFAALRGDFDSAKTAGPSDKYNFFGNCPSRAGIYSLLAILRYRHARAAVALLERRPYMNIENQHKKSAQLRLRALLAVRVQYFLTMCDHSFDCFCSGGTDGVTLLYAGLK